MYEVAYKNTSSSTCLRRTNAEVLVQLLKRVVTLLEWESLRKKSLFRELCYDAQ